MPQGLIATILATKDIHFRKDQFLEKSKPEKLFENIAETLNSSGWGLLTSGPFVM